MKDKKIKVNGIDLHVVDFGGQGEAIICVHGLTANCHYWDAVAERLIDKYRVIAVDLRGRGDSEKPTFGYNVFQHADDILKVMEFFRFEKVVYMGHSLGALIGTCFATKYPERLSRLILVDGGVEVNPVVYEKIRPAIERLDIIYPDFYTFLNEMKKNPFFDEWNEYMEQYFYADVEHRSDGSVRSKVRKQIILEEIKALRETAINVFHKKIQTPTLLLWAPDCFKDGKTFMVTKEEGERMMALIPNSQFVEIHHANHYSIILTKYEQFVEQVNIFLESTKIKG
ncbi:alpha/beta hydrolase [Bacillus sp. FJAT-47783]|uniref:alpha/beta fold hydrolase n=1 Tax=Bacillus sp. FJAT-47783 TaxID=2922712 RepID=UPI001FADBB13|nr:alpha/beta hydrolase [Bacillus sp. FJAT-47783]